MGGDPEGRDCVMVHRRALGGVSCIAGTHTRSPLESRRRHPQLRNAQMVLCCGQHYEGNNREGGQKAAGGGRLF